jgi:hypothetical protein
MPSSQAQSETIKIIKNEDPKISLSTSNNRVSYSFDECIQNKGGGAQDWSQIDKTFDSDYSYQLR